MVRNVRYRAGFTIVELLIVIVVIGILAAISIVAYSGIQQRARDASLQSSAMSAVKLMQIAYVTDGAYPSVFPTSLKLPTGTGMSLSTTGSSTSYCINAQMTTGGEITQKYYDSAVGQLQSGVCSGSVIASSETGTMSVNLISNVEFGGGWSLSLSVAGQAMTTRAGTAGDPYPTKPVLVWTNNVARTTSWAVVAGPVNYSQIISGQSYQSSYWVRKTGTGHSGTASVFGVMDGSTTNRALNTGANQTVDSTWTKVSGSSAAIASAVSSNRTYMSLSTTSFPTAGWTLEFQGFELYQL